MMFGVPIAVYESLSAAQQQDIRDAAEERQQRQQQLEQQLQQVQQQLLQQRRQHEQELQQVQQQQLQQPVQPQPQVPPAVPAAPGPVAPQTFFDRNVIPAFFSAAEELYQDQNYRAGQALSWQAKLDVATIVIRDHVLLPLHQIILQHSNFDQDMLTKRELDPRNAAGNNATETARRYAADFVELMMHTLALSSAREGEEAHYGLPNDSPIMAEARTVLAKMNRLVPEEAAYRAPSTIGAPVRGGKSRLEIIFGVMAVKMGATYFLSTGPHVKNAVDEMHKNIQNLGLEKGGLDLVMAGGKDMRVRPGTFVVCSLESKRQIKSTIDATQSLLDVDAYKNVPIVRCFDEAQNMVKTFQHVEGVKVDSVTQLLIKSLLKNRSVFICLGSATLLPTLVLGKLIWGANWRDMQRALLEPDPGAMAGAPAFRCPTITPRRGIFVDEELEAQLKADQPAIGLTDADISSRTALYRGWQHVLELKDDPEERKKIAALCTEWTPVRDGDVEVVVTREAAERAMARPEFDAENYRFRPQPGAIPLYAFEKRALTPAEVEFNLPPGQLLCEGPKKCSVATKCLLQHAVNEFCASADIVATQQDPVTGAMVEESRLVPMFIFKVNQQMEDGGSLDWAVLAKQWVGDRPVVLMIHSTMGGAGFYTRNFGSGPRGVPLVARKTFENTSVDYDAKNRCVIVRINYRDGRDGVYSTDSCSRAVRLVNHLHPSPLNGKCARIIHFVGAMARYGWTTANLLGNKLYQATWSTLALGKGAQGDLKLQSLRVACYNKFKPPLILITQPEFVRECKSLERAEMALCSMSADLVQRPNSNEWMPVPVAYALLNIAPRIVEAISDEEVNPGDALERISNLYGLKISTQKHLLSNQVQRPAGAAGERQLAVRKRAREQEEREERQRAIQRAAQQNHQAAPQPVQDPLPEEDEDASQYSEDEDEVELPYAACPIKWDNYPFLQQADLWAIVRDAFWDVYYKGNEPHVDGEHENKEYCARRVRAVLQMANLLARPDFGYRFTIANPANPELRLPVGANDPLNPRTGVPPLLQAIADSPERFMTEMKAELVSADDGKKANAQAIRLGLSGDNMLHTIATWITQVKFFVNKAVGDHIVAHYMDN